jgi:hypothetical protein
MSKRKKALALVTGNGVEPKPVRREVRLTRAQADTLLAVDRQIAGLQDRMNALVTGMLTGHNITNAQNVRFVGFDTDEPGLTVQDMTAVMKWRAKHQPAAPEPEPTATPEQTPGPAKKA